MKKMRKLIYFIATAALIIPISMGCKNNSNVLMQAELAKNQNELKNIYDLLNEYPALKSLFINETLTRQEFESKFFKEFLGDNECANDFITIMDGFPLLFDAREIPSGLFTQSMTRDIGVRGSLQDMLCVTSDLVQVVMDLPDNSKDKIFNFLNILSGSSKAQTLSSETLDRLLNLSALVTRYMSTLPDDKNQQGILEQLADILESIKGEENNSVDEISEEIRSLLYKTVAQIQDMDKEALDSFFQTVILELNELKNPADDKLDLADIEAFIKDVIPQLPTLIVECIDLTKSDDILTIAHTVKDMADQEEVRNASEEFLYSLSNLMKDPDTAPLIKDTVSKIDANFTEAQLKEVINRLWSQGQKTGQLVREMNVPGYGKDGKFNATMRDYLKNPVLLNSLMEYIYLAQKELADQGIKKLDFVDDGIIEVVTHDPHMQPMAGPGIFPGGKHYEPPTFNNVPFSYKNFSWFRGLNKLASRFSQPLSMTSTFLYEKETGLIDSNAFKDLLRFVPDIDSIPMGSFVWSDAYEKNPGREFGGGKVRRQLKPNEYGMLVNDLDANGNIQYDNNGKILKKVITPIFPELTTGAEIAFYAAADCIYHGPSNYMYDNVNWLFTGRKFYMVFDLIQVLPIFKLGVSNIGDVDPNLKWLVGVIGGVIDVLQWLGILDKTEDSLEIGQWMTNILKALGFKTLPIIAYEATGANEIIYIEAGQVFENMPDAIVNGMCQSGKLSGLLNNDFVKSLIRNCADLIVKLMDKITPLGYKNAQTGKVYLVPQDLRDLWPILSSIGFFDTNAFHKERLYNGIDHDNYAKVYDTTNHRFIENGKVSPHINKIAPLAGAVCLSVYKPYKDFLENYPLDAVATGSKTYYEVIRERQNAARQQYDGVVYPITYFINLFASLAESTSEENLYTKSDQQMPFIRTMEPLMAMKSSGILDNIIEISARLGSPEMIETRLKLCQALANLAAELPDSADAAAEALYTAAQEAKANPQYFEYMEKAFDIGGTYLSREYPIAKSIAGMLDPDHKIVATAVEILEYLNKAEITAGDVQNATGWMVDLMTACVEKNIFSRALVDFTDMLNSFDHTDPWKQMVNITYRGFESGGIMSYIILGMEKTPQYSWEQVFDDLNKFLKSDVMMDNGRGSFWSDLGYLAKFMAEAF